MKNQRTSGERSRYPAALTLWLGWASLVPLLAPIVAIPAIANAVVSARLCRRRPGKYCGTGLIWAGLALCLLGTTLFLIEGGLFLGWKRRQAYSQKVAVSRFRLSTLAGAMERFRSEKGRYPVAEDIETLNKQLSPRYAPSCPSKDAFGATIVVHSTPGGFILESRPPPPPGGGKRPPPLLVKGK